MDSLPSEAPSNSGARAIRFWKWNGWGFARSFNDVRFRDVALIIVIASTIWGRFDVVQRGQIRGDLIEIHKTDLTVFTEAGAAFFDGRDPYKVTNPRGWFYLYPPLFAILLAPLAPLDSQSQVGAWFAISIGLAFASFFEARRLWNLLAARVPGKSEGSRTVPWAWIAISAGLAVLLPTLDCLQRGQVGIALLYPLLLGSRLIFERRSWPRVFAGGLILAFPVVVKLIPLLPVGALIGLLWVASLFRQDRSGSSPRASAATLGLFVGGFLFLLAIPASLVGWEKNLVYLETWSRGVAANPHVDKLHGFDIYSVRNQSLANGLHLLAHAIRGPIAYKTEVRELNDSIDRASLILRGFVMLALTVTGLVLGRRAEPLGHAAAFGLACAAMLLVSPLSWGHYFLLELPAILFFPLWLCRNGWTEAAKGFASVAAVLIWAQYTSMSGAGAIGLLGLGTAAWFLTACVVVFVVESSKNPGRSELRPAVHLGVSHLFERSPSRGECVATESSRGTNSP